MEWGIFVQRSVDSRLVIVGGIWAKDTAQVRFAEYDHVVEAFPSDRANESLNIRILPRRSGRDRPVVNAHGAQTLAATGSRRPWRVAQSMSGVVASREFVEFQTGEILPV